MTDIDESEVGVSKITPATKVCPFCAETILAAAKKCKHCGEFLIESAVTEAPASAGSDPIEDVLVLQAHEQKKVEPVKRLLGYTIAVLFGIPAFGSLVKGELIGVLLGLFSASFIPALADLLYKKFGRSVIIVRVLLFIGAVVATPPSPKLEQNSIAQPTPKPIAASELTAPPVRPTAVPTRGAGREGSSEEASYLTPSKFQKRFDERAEELNLPQSVRIGSVEVTQGSVNDAFGARLGTQMALVGAVEKTHGRIIGATLIAQSDGTMSTATDVVLVELSLIDTFSPNLAAQKQHELAMDLLKKAMNKKETTFKKRVGEYTYFASFSPLAGYMFGVDEDRAKGIK